MLGMCMSGLRKWNLHEYKKAPRAGWLSARPRLGRLHTGSNPTQKRLTALILSDIGLIAASAGQRQCAGQKLVPQALQSCQN